MIGDDYDENSSMDRGECKPESIFFRFFSLGPHLAATALGFGGPRLLGDGVDEGADKELVALLGLGVADEVVPDIGDLRGGALPVLQRLVVRRVRNVVDDDIAVEAKDVLARPEILVFLQLVAHRLGVDVVLVLKLLELLALHLLPRPRGIVGQEVAECVGSAGLADIAHNGLAVDDVAAPDGHVPTAQFPVVGVGGPERTHPRVSSLHRHMTIAIPVRKQNEVGHLDIVLLLKALDKLVGDDQGLGQRSELEFFSGG